MSGSGNGDEAERALAQALKLLRHRARSRYELRLALERRGHPEGVVAATLLRLAELGYLDDARFARARAVALFGKGGRGESLVRQRLRAHGLAAAQAEAALEEARAEVGFDPLAAGRRLLERRGLWGRPLEDKEKARAARLLTARGFSEEVVETLLRMASALDPPYQGG